MEYHVNFRWRIGPILRDLLVHEIGNWFPYKVGTNETHRVTEGLSTLTAWGLTN